MTTTKDFIYDTIKHWVGKNFGSQEADDPSWDIDSLSSYLARQLEQRDRKTLDLKRYELTVLLPEEVDYALAIEKIEDYIRQAGGKITSTENEGVKRLAYAINNHERADYVYMNIDLPKDAPVKISTWLNINDSVLRYLLVQADTRRI